MGQVDRSSLSNFERELLELCSDAPNMGETTTTLHEEMLSEDHDRLAVEAALRGLVGRGLMRTSRGTFGGTQRLRSGHVEHRVYEDDWWILTDEGRAVVGLPSRRR